MGGKPVLRRDMNSLLLSFAFRCDSVPMCGSSVGAVRERAHQQRFLDGQRAAVSRAIVRVADEQDAMSQRTQTHQSGSFVFLGLAARQGHAIHRKRCGQQPVQLALRISF